MYINFVVDMSKFYVIVMVKQRAFFRINNRFVRFLWPKTKTTQSHGRIENHILKALLHLVLNKCNPIFNESSPTPTKCKSIHTVIVSFWNQSKTALTPNSSEDLLLLVMVKQDELWSCYLPSIVDKYRGHHKYKSSNTEPCCDVNIRVKSERWFTEYCPEEKAHRGDNWLKKKNPSMLISTNTCPKLFEQKTIMINICLLLLLNLCYYEAIW